MLSRCPGSTRGPELEVPPVDFFPDPPEPREQEPEEDEGYQPVWHSAPEDVLPGVVPIELILGRSQSTVVMLTGIRAFPESLAMNLAVRVRGPLGGRDLHAEVFDGPYPHDTGAQWQRDRLKWGWEFADGRRATSVDQPAWDDERAWTDKTWRPPHPVLTGQGGGGSRRSIDRDFILWPLPPPGRLRLVFQWPQQGIEQVVHDLDAQPFLDAAARARPVWQ